MRYHILIVLLIPLIFQNQLSGQVQPTDTEFHEMLDDLYSWSVPVMMPEELVANGMGGYILLDAREKKEFEVSHLPGAVYTGYNKVEDEVLAKLPKNKPVVVYCSVGYRSERIGEKLKSMGFDSVYNLYGGIFEWKNKGFEVVNDKGTKTEEVHAYDKDWGRWLREGKKVY
ncbi:MAG: rhodanese-like domain-containing protein [Bacteroidota bacterium]